MHLDIKHLQSSCHSSNVSYFQMLRKYPTQKPVLWYEKSPWTFIYFSCFWHDGLRTVRHSHISVNFFLVYIHILFQSTKHIHPQILAATTFSLQPSELLLRQKCRHSDNNKVYPKSTHNLPQIARGYSHHCWELSCSEQGCHLCLSHE